MRSLLVMLLCVSFLGVFAGCSGSPIDEGVPDQVDMTKDYSPAATPLNFSPKDESKAKKAAAEASK